MGEYLKNQMEEYKKDKMKRSKHDHVSQVVFNYLQKRNYPLTTPTGVSQQDLRLDMLVDHEVSRPNAVMYSCYNSDPMIMDHSYLKFITWLKEVSKVKDCEDLLYIVGPLFCHLYLEMVQRGHSEKASNFLKVHLPLIDKLKCDETILKLLNMFANDTLDINGLKTKFRSNKYVIELKPASVQLLKKNLSESCHMVMLQVFQTCFEVKEMDKMETEDETTLDQTENIENNSIPTIERLKNVISAIKTDNTLIYSVSLSNLKEDVTCGLINREVGIAAYCYNSSIFLKPLETLKQLEGADELSDIVFREHRKRVYDISYVKQYNFLVSASQDTTLRLFDLNTYTQKVVYKGHNYPVYCLSTTENGNFIASGSYDHSARLWSTENSNTIRVYVGHTQEVTSIDFHPNGIYLATGSADKCIRMWSINDANPVRLFLGCKGIVYSLAFSSNGKYLASAGDDKRLRIWDLVCGKQLSELKVGVEPIVKLCWNSDDSTLCAGTADGLVRTWDVNNINNVESNQYSTRCNVNLNSKLLDIENSLSSFGCLTAKMANSVLA